jgi:aspartyl-tRNA synthetase
VSSSHHQSFSVLYYPFLSFPEILVFWQALHPPFTAPNPEDMKDLSSARALAYDMVYNGVEVLSPVSLHVYKLEGDARL